MQSARRGRIFFCQRNLFPFGFKFFGYFSRMRFDVCSVGFHVTAYVCCGSGTTRQPPQVDVNTDTGSRATDNGLKMSEQRATRRPEDEQKTPRPNAHATRKRTISDTCHNKIRFKVKQATQSTVLRTVRNAQSFFAFFLRLKPWPQVIIQR